MCPHPDLETSGVVEFPTLLRGVGGTECLPVPTVPPPLVRELRVPYLPRRVLRRPLPVLDSSLVSGRTLLSPPVVGSRPRGESGPLSGLHPTPTHLSSFPPHLFRGRGGYGTHEGGL